MCALEQSNLDGSEDPNTWDLSSQSFDSLYPSSATFKNTELSDTQKLTDEYFENIKFYNTVSQAISDIEPAPMEPLSFSSPSIIAWPSLYPNTTKLITPPIDTSNSSMPSHSEPTDPTPRRFSGSPMKSKNVKKGSSSSTRRTLTCKERREICVFNRDNPTVKQANIAKLFNIERSTVSKVLSFKDKYLSEIDAGSYLEKQNKGKFQKLERTICNWVVNEVTNGQTLTDDQIKSQARKFAELTNDPESLDKCDDKIWLAKFNQKNISETTRRHSEPNFRPEMIPFHVSSSPMLQNTNETQSSSVLRQGLMNKEVKSDKVAKFKYTGIQCNSDSNSYSVPESTASSTSYSIALDSPVVKAPPKSKSSQRKRRKTLPVINTNQTSYGAQNLQNSPNEILQSSNSSFQIDFLGNSNKQILSRSTDQISSTNQIKRDYSEFVSSIRSPIQLENIAQQPISVNTVPNSVTIEAEALKAFELLINYYSKKDKTNISQFEFDSFYKLSEKMGLIPDSSPEFPRSF